MDGLKGIPLHTQRPEPRIRMGHGRWFAAVGMIGTLHESGQKQGEDNP